MFKVGLLPLEVMRMLPLTPPVATGANCTEKDVLCPALRVNGKVMPLRLKPVPLADPPSQPTLGVDQQTALASNASKGAPPSSSPQPAFLSSGSTRRSG